MAHNTVGKEVAPRLAARERAALVTDCVDLRIDATNQALVGTRPCFSGKAFSEWVLDGDGPKIATLRRQSILAEEAAPVQGAITDIPLPDLLPVRTSVVERVVPPPGQVRLEDAEVVVSVGRGVGTRAEFESYIVDGLARALGAACGGSRGAVDLGIVPPELQVGLTGRVVSPKVYIAVGLSGAPQHMAGCGGARNIIAINTDPQAPIFGYAHYGVLGDYRKVVPALTARLREILAVPA
jgi:electron transfer flavoprotein alpha subunit